MQTLEIDSTLLKTRKLFWSNNALYWKTHRPLTGEIESAGRIVSTVKKHTTIVLNQVAEVGKNYPMLDLCSGADGLAYYPDGTNPSRIWAVDISDEMLLRNQAGVKVSADVTEGLPVSDSAFAAVTMFFGWTHLYYGQEYHAGLYMDPRREEIHRQVLKYIYDKVIPGGALIIIDVPLGYMSLDGKIKTRQFRHIEIASMARKVGFNLVQSGILFRDQRIRDDNITIQEIAFLNAIKPQA